MVRNGIPREETVTVGGVDMVMSKTRRRAQRVVVWRGLGGLSGRSDDQNELKFGECCRKRETRTRVKFQLKRSSTWRDMRIVKKRVAPSGTRNPEPDTLREREDSTETTSREGETEREC